MITYIYQKDSTLWAFEGPEEPKYCADFGDIVLICGNTFCRCDSQLKGHIAAMSTARGSALPVVNLQETGFGSSWWVTGLNETGLIEFESIKPGETVPLPGWALEKVEQKKMKGQEWFIPVKGQLFRGTEYSTRQAYRLKRSEPDGIEMNHAVVDEFTKPIPIKLTFKSGSLWYGEYEVVNPEVIPWTPGGFERCVDGDQITLPDGYGIKERKYRQRGEVNGPERREATIILPEKPENSAHGYTEGAECESNGHIFEGTVIEGAERCQICGEGREPSESQEEKRYTELEVRLIANQCVNEYAGHLASNGCDVLPFDEFNINEWLDEKLTRK